MMLSSLANKIQDQLRDKLTSYGEHKYLIAVSGGIDSMALAFLASSLEEFDFHALIIDHSLRKSSKEEAQKTSQILDSLKIKNEIIHLQDGHKITSNIEANARNMRYNALCNYAKQHDYKIIILAHQQDDILENFFIRLARGSGIDGLASIEETTIKQGINFVRPFLNIKKATLKNILGSNNIPWVEDPSNADEKFLRNKIRNLLAELLTEEELETRILQTANHCQRAKKFLQAESQKILQEITQTQGTSYQISHLKLKNLPEEIALRVLILILENFANNSYKPRFKQLDQLYRKLISLDFNRQITFSHCLIKKKKIAKEQFLIFSKEHKDKP